MLRDGNKVELTGLLVTVLSENGFKSCKRDGRKLFVDTFIALVT